MAAADNGNLILENRSKLCVSAVTDVESFDEKRIVLKTGDCRLIILGSGLKLSQVSVDEGEATIVGLIDSCAYTSSGKGSIWGRISK